LVVGGDLAVESSADEVTAIDLVTGGVRWRSHVDDLIYAQPQSGVVVVTAQGGSVVLDEATGSELWSLDQDSVSLVGGDDLLVSVQLGG
jgi:hypothetical protein